MAPRSFPHAFETPRDERSASDMLKEIAGHLNRIVQQNTEIISLMMLSNGLRPLTAEEQEWLKACRKEASKAA